MLGMRPMQDDAGTRHMQMWPSANVPTVDENAHAQPRGKAGERVVTFRDPEGLGSVRKAFGGVPPAATQLGKTPKTAARRRALGDITNATPARGVATEFKASAAKTAARPAAAEPAAAATQHSVAEAQIHAWAEEGVERRAGKSWAVLEAERRRRDEADIAAGVEAMLSFLTRGPLAYGSRSAATWAMLDAAEDGQNGSLSNRSSPVAHASSSKNGLEWDAAELAAAIAALPVLDSDSPIRTWQLDDAREDTDEDACSAESDPGSAD